MHNDFVYINGDTPYFQSRLFNDYGLKHAFFTKKGGVSKGCFESLNFAEGIGEIQDSTENVMENYNIAAQVFGLTKADVCRTYQTHTNLVEYADEACRGIGTVKPKYDHGVDGLVTMEKNLLLSVRTADCVPVLLCDKSNSICAAVHAGWRGTVGGITKNAVRIMIEKGAKPENILAAIGPCIGACCYQVGGEVRDEFISVSAEYAQFFTDDNEKGKYKLDLVKANAYILQTAGILPQNISCANLCTLCNEEHFFSHRRSGSLRGTLGAFIQV